jgi:transcriptional regulator with XRE-family HTH domain
MLYRMQHNQPTAAETAANRILAANVVALRRRAKLSQSALAAAAGLSRSTIASIEGAKYDTADLTTVERIAKVLGVGVDELRRPTVERMAMHPLIELFQASELAKGLAPTDDELEWLRSLPDMVWANAKSAPDTVARMLLWRRDTTSRP